MPFDEHLGWVDEDEPVAKTKHHDLTVAERQRGARNGGLARKAKLSQERRSEIARQGGLARQAKK
jgi:hypothetical protein